MKSKLMATMALCGWLINAAAQTSLTSYIDTALKNNPLLRAYSYQSSALQQNIKPSKALEDPMLYGGVMYLPLDLSFRQDPMTMKQLGFQQNFSVSRKYSLKGKVAEKEYEASLYNVQEQQLLLAYKVKRQYYNLYAISKAIETTGQSIETLKNYTGIANTRYSTGQGTQQDVLKSQLELTKIQQELITLRSEQNDMTASFNTLLGRDKTMPVDVPRELKFYPVELTMDSLMQDAGTNNPTLLYMKTAISKDSASYELAKASKIPDFNAGAYYGQRQYTMADGSKAMDMIGGQFGMTIPMWSKNKQNPLIAESRINIQKSQSELESAKNEVELLIHHAMVDAKKNEQLINLYGKQLIPQATENLNAGITGYQENKIDFLTLIDNFISLYNCRLQYQQAIADYMQAMAEFEMITGKNLIQ